ncbi:MAG: hypothetical protein K8J09_04405 [Planctomycetes bacterium]|nr:hypothetical protein [Planctomycetota bacterium]MCC7398859.1 hypothetical protein [Planctomycetota bacterium]
MGSCNPWRRVGRALRLPFGITIPFASVVAQCGITALPSIPFAGVDGTVVASVNWDPDGAGPLPARVVVAGTFKTAGNAVCTGVAMFDEQTREWSRIGTLMTGTSSSVQALAVLPNGQLAAGGSNLTAYGIHVAAWDGSSWQPLANVIGTEVSKLAIAGNADLIASGTFTNIGGVAASRIARWDGTSWAPLGAGLTSTPQALLAMTNGDVVAGGSGFNLGGLGYHGIARWDGLAWSTLGAGITSNDGTVTHLLELANGDLLVCGSLYTVGDGAVVARGVARWDGSNWSSLGTGTDYNGATLAIELPTGTLVVTGPFSSAGGTSAPGIAEWDGSAWSAPYASPAVNGTDEVRTMAVSPSGKLIVGGNLPGHGFANIAAWSGQAWRSLGGGIDGAVLATLALPDGSALVGGSFRVIDGVAADYLAKWDGNSWQPVGAGLNGAVTALAMSSDGRLFVGGDFTMAGSSQAAHMAVWDGVQWGRLAGGITSGSQGTGLRYVEDMLVDANEDLIVCGGFSELDGTAANRVGRWDGSAWSPLGPNGLSNHPFVLAERDGVLFAGTAFGVHKWNGSQWANVGLSFNSSVVSLGWLPNGDLVAGGYFTQAGGVPCDGVARWNGTLWWPVGVDAPHAMSMVSLPNGDLVAAGYTGTSTSTANSTRRVYRWNGSSWSAISGAFTASSDRLSLAWLTSGEVMVGGSFTRQDTAAHAYLARFATTCPAAVASFGSGCPGSGGTTHLASTAPAWVGGTPTAEASGLPANGIGIVMRGLLTANLPLSTIFPQAGANCALLVDPLFLQVVLPVAGTATTAITIPPSPQLAGLVLHEQILALDLGATGSLVDATTSNRLTLTVGIF